MIYNDNQTVAEHNKILFDKFRKLNLPRGQYAVVSGGPLAIRGIKKTGDVDVLVSEVLWNKLVKKYGVTSTNDYGTQIVTVDEDVDILHFAKDVDTGPDDSEQIRDAEDIDGIMFQSLNDCILFKKIMRRQKDAKDLLLLKDYLKVHPEDASKITIDF